MPVLKSLLLLRSRRAVQTSPQTTAASPGSPGLSVAVVAHNEAELLPSCLDSVKSIASEIIVVDAGSDDATAEVAAEYADQVISAENQLEVDATKNLAIAAATYDWILIVDPDERVTPALRAEIAAVVTGPPEHDGYLIPRRNYELGMWIRTMGHYPGPQLRLIRRGRGRYAPERLHEHLQLQGTVGVLTADLIHLPRASVWDYAHKRNFYSEQRSRQLFAEGVRFSRRRLVWSPVVEFCRQYLVLAGWIDGVAGFVIAAHGGWAAFLTEAKLWQLWLQQPGAWDGDDAGPDSGARADRSLSSAPPPRSSATPS